LSSACDIRLGSNRHTSDLHALSVSPQGDDLAGAAYGFRAGAARKLALIESGINSTTDKT
jgi:hypothetical protein